MISIRFSNFSRGVAVAALAATLGACGIFGGDDPKTTPTIGERKPVLSRIESGASVDPSLAGVSVQGRSSMTSSLAVRSS